jgi:hypothetical protein
MPDHGSDVAEKIHHVADDRYDSKHGIALHWDGVLRETQKF